MNYTFDGEHALILMPEDISAVNVADLYSRWVDWYLTADNSKYRPAFRTAGGDPLPGNQYLGTGIFLQNQYGWRLRPDERDHELTMIGNLYPETSDYPMFVPTVNGHTVAVFADRSAQTIATDHTSGNVTIGDYAAGKSPADLILANPANKLMIDSSGKVGLTHPPALKKNTAFNNFGFAMVLASDHITPATGKMVTATRSIDGGTFAACTNGVMEISAGAYKINLAAKDLNGDVIAFKFTNADCDQVIIWVYTNQ